MPPTGPRAFTYYLRELYDPYFCFLMFIFLVITLLVTWFINERFLRTYRVSIPSPLTKFNKIVFALQLTSFLPELFAYFYYINDPVFGFQIWRLMSRILMITVAYLSVFGSEIFVPLLAIWSSVFMVVAVTASIVLGGSLVLSIVAMYCTIALILLLVSSEKTPQEGEWQEEYFEE